jgi:5-methyltetrahydrofolate--homocysteine methyltransferase
MAAGLPTLLAAGPRIVGGCCGSTPEHIRLFRKILDQREGEHGLRPDGVA